MKTNGHIKEKRWATDRKVKMEEEQMNGILKTVPP
jgi:hypothetical protein